jgi:RND superfamily putative drug exporter
MSRPFQSLGRFVARHPRTLVAVWAIAIALGAWGARKFPAQALGGSAELFGSPSKEVSVALRGEFDNPLLDPLVAVVVSRRLDIDQPPLRDWTREAAQALRGLAGVREVVDYPDTPDPQLRSADGRSTALLIGLAASDVPALERAVPQVRAAFAPLRTRLLALDPDARFAVTGGPAVDYDINTSSAEGGDAAEKRALPLTLLILVIAFGTLVAASLPFLMGLATTMVALGLAYLLARVMPVSNLLGNVVTMVGLAVGIDYSLLMVKDYRERLRAGLGEGAVAATVAEAGATITWSGCTVAIGLLGLLWSPILETRSVGIGGALVVMVSVLAALTLLPASLALLGPRIERLRIGRSRALGGGVEAWRRMATWTVRRPLLSLVLSGGAVLALGLPVLHASTGFTNEAWFLPKALESRVGADLLAGFRKDNASLAVHLLVRATDGQAIVAPAHRGSLAAYVSRLTGDARIARVNSAFDPRLPAPRRAEFLSHDGSATLIEVVPADRLSVAQIQTLTRDLGRQPPAGPFRLVVGGNPAYYNDFTDTMWASVPKVFGFVIVATLVLLYAAFRSFLLPVKAVLANLLAIGAGFGAVVAIFQFGWLHTWVGLEHPFSSIALEIPLMIFCLSFGLSMDYELFLLFRIQKEYLAHGDNDRATIAGLSAVAPVITGAGLIMAAVFGAFVSADLPALKMIGVGLCVAVLVDATLIRGFVVPAVMCLAGRWNWFPGRRGPGRLQ